MILISKQTGQIKDGLAERILQIFELKGFRSVFEKKITDSHYNSRLEKENLILKDGHIYYGNNVIKIRYDQIEKQDQNQLTNEQVFDHYADLFDLPGKSI